MEHLPYWVVIAVLVCVVSIQIAERKSLLDRIMAGNLTEYKSAGKPRKAIKNIIKKNLQNR